VIAAVPPVIRRERIRAVASVALLRHPPRAKRVPRGSSLVPAMEPEGLRMDSPHGWIDRAVVAHSPEKG
jgi:hypothetical protein